MQDKIEIVEEDNAIRILAPVNLDAVAVPQFRHIVDQVSGSLDDEVLQVDLERTAFMDSAGAGFLVTLCRLVKSQGRELHIANATDQPAALIQRMQINRVATVL